MRRERNKRATEIEIEIEIGKQREGRDQNKWYSGTEGTNGEQGEEQRERRKKYKGVLANERKPKTKTKKF